LVERLTSQLELMEKGASRRPFCFEALIFKKKAPLRTGLLED
jgi:hypothetical protein